MHNIYSCHRPQQECFRLQLICFRTIHLKVFCTNLKPVFEIFVSSSLSEEEIALFFDSSFTTSGTRNKLLDAIFVFTIGTTVFTFSSDSGTGVLFAFICQPLLSSAERDPVAGLSLFLKSVARDSWI